MAQVEVVVGRELGVERHVKQSLEKKNRRRGEKAEDRGRGGGGGEGAEVVGDRAGVSRQKRGVIGGANEVSNRGEIVHPST